jgi:tRNA A-37 threonylcarbamoyl transferase component Bud32
MNFSRHIAGSSRIVAACLYYHYSSLSTSRTGTQVLLVIEDFQPRIMNYVKALGVSTLVVLAVDKWVFERDVDRGLLGEALAGGLIFPYEPIVNVEYLHLREIVLKRRLILELLQSLVLDFPELSYEFYIKPRYFLYETWLTRARLFPPMLDSLSSLVKEEANLQQPLDGFLSALKKLEENGTIRFSGDYIKISKEFVDKARTRKARFTSLLKTGNRALFASLLGMLPQMMNALSQNKASFFNLPRMLSEGIKAGTPFDDPKSLVYVKTASGLVPLANRMDIGAFARKVFRAGEGAQIKVASIGGILNDVYLVSASIDGKDKKVVVKRFRDWSNFKWFPLTLWTIGTRTFAVLGSSRLERECAINRLLHSEGIAVPELLYVSPNERLIFMEYVLGEDLSNAVRRIAGSKNDGELRKDIDLIAKVGSLFAKVHVLGVSLGDTKPENILVDKKGELYHIDLEQAGRYGDKAWDVAEFLYYSGHYISPFADARRVEVMANAFIAGYLQAGGNINTIGNAGKAKYTKVFSVFTFPHLMLILSNVCRKTG